MRVGDHSYLSHIDRGNLVKNSGDLDLIFSFESTGLTCAKESQFYRDLSRVLPKVSQEELEEGFYIKYENKFYHIQFSHSSVLERIAKITNFLRIGPEKKKIVCISQAPHSSGSTVNIGIKFLSKKLKASAIQAQISQNYTPQKELHVEDLKKNAYEDPFTKLASEAFQKFERDYAAHDTERTSDTVIVYAKGKLLLLDRAKLPEFLKKYPEASKQALDSYWSFAEKEWGEEKVQYIRHLYRLGDVSELTPEVVYRMNIGSSNFEIQDLKELFMNLQIATGEINPESDLKSTLADWVNHGLLSRREAKGLLELMEKQWGEGDCKVRHLLHWLKSLDIEKPENIDPISLSHLSSLYLPGSQEEVNAMHTGRRIPGPAISGYSTADYKVYKPWIDQQSLAIAVEEFSYFLDSNENFDRETAENYYYEWLSHTICKYHLEREHPREGFRVGAIIPALPSEDGIPQFYVVERMIMSGTGLYSYQLKPMGKNSELPAIFLARSTASAAYARAGARSIRNDLDPLNSPGYEGRILRKSYDQEFFKQHSIPVWVGYTLQAEKLLKEKKTQEAAKALTLAISSYFNSELQAFRAPSLKEVMGKYSFLLNDLIYEGYWNQPWPLKQQKKLEELVLSFAIGNERNRSLDRKALDLLLTLLPKSNCSDHIRLQFLEELSNATLDQLDSLELEREQFMNQSLSKELLGNLNHIDPHSKEKDLAIYTEKLLKLAQKKDELPSQKSQTGLVITGHSLGGAISQSMTSCYFSQAHRIPLPGQTASLFLYDDPAINQEDSQQFIHFNNEHRVLLSDLNTGYRIRRSHESGDFVPFSGGQHLGSLLPEQKEMEKTIPIWLDEKNYVHTPLSSSLEPTTSESSSAHATRFGLGKEGVDFTKSSISPLQLGKFDSQKSDADRKNIKKIWNILPQTPLRFLTPSEIEKVRRFFSIPLRAFRPSTINDSNESKSTEWHQYKNEDGVFGVDYKKGILTK